MSISENNRGAHAPSRVVSAPSLKTAKECAAPVTSGAAPRLGRFEHRTSARFRARAPETTRGARLLPKILRQREPVLTTPFPPFPPVQKTQGNPISRGRPPLTFTRVPSRPPWLSDPSVPSCSRTSAFHPRLQLSNCHLPSKNLQKTTNFILRKVFSRDWKSVRAVVAFLAWKTHLLHAVARSSVFLTTSHSRPASPPGSAPSRAS